MNYRERKAYSYLLLIQGSYCFILGLLLFSIQISKLYYAPPLLPESHYISYLLGGILLGIGLTLIFSRRNYKQNLSSYLLGFITATAFLLHNAIYLYHFEGNNFLWLDLLIQLGFFLCWIWLIYWKWIENKFAEM